MQSTSELYNTLLRTKGHTKETRAVIGGVEAKALISLKSTGMLFSKDIDIGQCISRTFTMKFIPGGPVPRKAKIENYVRLRFEEQASEWIPKGVFYINTRSTDKVTGVMTVDGFDAMRGADVEWAPDQSLTFPMPMNEAFTILAALIGVEVDERSDLNSAYTIDYPANGYTIRDELGFIASAHAGNCIITDAGKLLLVPLLSAPEENNYLVTEHGDAITLGGVKILV